MKGVTLFLLCLVSLLFNYKCSSAQDTIFIFDVASGLQSFRLLPPYDKHAVADSTAPYFGVNGVTHMPDTATNPGLKMTELRKASYYYSDFNFPFTAVSLIKYGFNITVAAIGRRTLLVSDFDIHNYTDWRYLFDENPLFENGSIQYGYSKLTPVRYYSFDAPLRNHSTTFGAIEVAEDIGSFGGYFGFAFDTMAYANDSVLLYNLSYPKEGYPQHYSFPVNGDTLCMKYGYINNEYSNSFNAYYGGDGEYVSPYFDSKFRIRAIRWSTTTNPKIQRKDFYFFKYVIDSLATGVNNIESPDQFNIFPNPVTENLFIVSDSKQIEIKDLLGRTIYDQIATPKQTTINVSQLPAGIYFAIIKSEDGSIAVRKFVKAL